MLPIWFYDNKLWGIAPCQFIQKRDYSTLFNDQFFSIYFRDVVIFVFSLSLSRKGHYANYLLNSNVHKWSSLAIIS